MIGAADEWEAARFARRRLLERCGPRPGGRDTVLGLALAVVVAACVAAASAMWPTAEKLTPTDGTALVLADGRIFVVDDGTLYPAPNLVSALLAADRVEHLRSLPLTGLRIGEPRGISAAITALPEPDALLPAQWQLCDGPGSAPRLTVGAAPYLPPPPGEVTLLDDGGGLWQVVDGTRTAVAGVADDRVAVAVSPALVGLLDQVPHALDAPSASHAEVVCVQSDPAAPFARPSAAAIARAEQQAAPVNSGTRVVLPTGAGLLARQADGTGYWLLSYTGELAPIADDATLARLGYRPRQAAEVPEQLLATLIAGPELSISAARLPVADTG